MTPENFFYWLQGFFELSGTTETLTKTQVLIIKDHMALVANKVTPERTDPEVNDQDKTVSAFKSDFDLSDAEQRNLMDVLRVNTCMSC